MLITAIGNYPKIPNRPRPARLRNAISAFERGKLSLEGLREVEDAVTREVIEEQEQAGLDLVTDGQIRWDDGQTYLARKIPGFSIDGLIRYFDTNTYYRQPVLVGPPRWEGPISVRDYRFATAASPRPVKAVVTGPYTLARLSRWEASHDLRAVVRSLAEVLQQEVRALAAAGAPWIQVDEPAILRHKADFPLFADAMRILTEGIDAPLALALYFGDVDGLYPGILSLPFRLVSLDFVQGPRNFEILEWAPFTRELGFGLMDARNTRMEGTEELLQKIDRIRPICPLARLHIHPHCGLEFLPREVAHQKLVRLAEAGRKARELFE